MTADDVFLSNMEHSSVSFVSFENNKMLLQAVGLLVFVCTPVGREDDESLIGFCFVLLNLPAHLEAQFDSYFLLPILFLFLLYLAHI